MVELWLGWGFDKMPQILKNLGCLWGWQGSFSSTTSSRALETDANLSTFSDFRLPLGESWGPPSSWALARLPNFVI